MGDYLFDKSPQTTFVKRRTKDLLLESAARALQKIWKIRKMENIQIRPHTTFQVEWAIVKRPFNIIT